MNKKWLVVLSITGVLLFLVVNFSSIKKTIELQNKDIEEQTIYFLHPKYDEEWKQLDDKITFNYTQRSGINKLIYDDEFIVSANSTDKRELGKVIKKSSVPNVLFKVIYTDNISIESELPTDANILVVRGHAELSDYTVFEILNSKGKYTTNLEMQQELGVSTQEIVDITTDKKNRYLNLLKRIYQNELARCTSTRNDLLLLSGLFLVSYLVLITGLHLFLKFLKTKRIKNKDKFYEEL
ncbi:MULTISPECIES: hypothetical protein [Listeria]|uniref:hypothetical protein n=1 Tax=Listeria TaxID=1637 RepID=UPI000B594657|nr:MULTISPECIES: hypothetical protein [Listeria]